MCNTANFDVGSDLLNENSIVSFIGSDLELLALHVMLQKFVHFITSFESTCLFSSWNRSPFVK